MECFWPKQDILTMVEASPKLKCLFLTGSDGKAIAAASTVTQLFQHDTFKKLQLDCLAVVGFAVKADAIKNLITNKLKVLRLFKFQVMPWDSIWIACGLQKCHLTQLNISGNDEIEQHVFGRASLQLLLNFLLSFRELKELEILNVSLRDQETENRAGQAFWTDVIECHRSSLQELSVTSKLNGDWCYGPLAERSISRCDKLEKLTISIGAIDPVWRTLYRKQPNTRQEIDLGVTLKPDSGANNLVSVVKFHVSSVSTHERAARSAFSVILRCQTSRAWKS